MDGNGNVLRVLVKSFMSVWNGVGCHRQVTKHPGNLLDDE